MCASVPQIAIFQILDSNSELSILKNGNVLAWSVGSIVWIADFDVTINPDVYASSTWLPRFFRPLTNILDSFLLTMLFNQVTVVHIQLTLALKISVKF